MLAPCAQTPRPQMRFNLSMATVTATNEREQMMVATQVDSSLLPENNTYCGRRRTASRNNERCKWPVWRGKSVIRVITDDNLHATRHNRP